MYLVSHKIGVSLSALLLYRYYVILEKELSVKYTLNIYQWNKNNIDLSMVFLFWSNVFVGVIIFIGLMFACYTSVVVAYYTMHA